MNSLSDTALGGEAPVGAKMVELPGGPAFIVGDENDNYFARAAEIAPTMSSLAGLLSHFAPEDGVILDIGANIGLTAISLARAAGDRPLKAFEPSPVNSGYLRQNIANNHLSNVQVIAAGVSHRRGDLGFHDGAFRAGSHVVSDGHMAPGRYRNQTVPMVTLDETITDRVVFMKIDVEGHEPNVLAGARNILERDRPLIFMEFNVWCLNAFGGHSPSAFAAALWKAFDVWRLRDGKLVPMDLEAVGFIYKTIVEREDSDIVLRLKEGAAAPSLEEMSLPREIAEELVRLRASRILI